eukprot:gene16756-19922_t
MSGIRSWINRGNKLARFALIFALLFGSSTLYILYNQETAPVTGRARFIGVTMEEERELGDMGYNQIMEVYADRFLPDNTNLQNQVRTVAKVLIQHANRPDLAWECHVINSPEINAFVLPNGKIFVFTGLFDIVSTEDELAAVLSHEIGHAIARHGAEHMSILKVGIVFLTLTRGLLGDTITGNISTMISTRLLELSYSRMQEIEADEIGLGIMKRANFNLDAAIRVQERLTEATGDVGKFEVFFSTHPNNQERIKKMKQWIACNGQCTSDHGSKDNKPSSNGRISL